MKLTKRLSTVAGLVSNNSIVADIGTDHGYIPKFLVDEEISKIVIATDISKGSLDKTIGYIEDENLSDFIIPRLGDGLEPIKPFEVDTIIIAGMGGLLIAEILETNKEKLDSYLEYILQPMVGAEALRKYLINNGFKIIKEKVVREGDKFYEIIKAIREISKIDNEIEYEISPLWEEDDEDNWKEMINNRLELFLSVKDELTNKESIKSKERLEEVVNKINIYKEVLGFED